MGHARRFYGFRFHPVREVQSKSLRGTHDLKDAHIFDLLNSEIRISWDSDSLWSDINDDHHRPSDKSLEEVVNLLVGSPKFRS